jgi:hypothetical protein
VIDGLSTVGGSFGLGVRAGSIANVANVSTSGRKINGFAPLKELMVRSVEMLFFFFTAVVFLHIFLLQDYSNDLRSISKGAIVTNWSFLILIFFQFP